MIRKLASLIAIIAIIISFSTSASAQDWEDMRKAVANQSPTPPLVVSNASSSSTSPTLAYADTGTSPLVKVADTSGDNVQVKKTRSVEFVSASYGNLVRSDKFGLYGFALLGMNISETFKSGKDAGSNKGGFMGGDIRLSGLWEVNLFGEDIFIDPGLSLQGDTGSFDNSEFSGDQTRLLLGPNLFIGHKSKTGLPQFAFTLRWLFGSNNVSGSSKNSSFRINQDDFLSVIEVAFDDFSWYIETQRVVRQFNGKPILIQHGFLPQLNARFKYIHAFSSSGGDNTANKNKTDPKQWELQGLAFVWQGTGEISKFFVEHAYGFSVTRLELDDQSQTSFTFNFRAVTDRAVFFNVQAGYLHVKTGSESDIQSNFYTASASVGVSW